MSSSRPSAVPTSEKLPCPECGKTQMVRVAETVRLADGLTVKKLAHYKCRSCGSRFFDDDAMHTIQAARTARRSSVRAR
jgi:YgiT-type zinc finger domain-containing protein